jgi:hypothetical protein
MANAMAKATAMAMAEATAKVRTKATAKVHVVNEITHGYFYW